jgi:hypothetical protein
MSLTSKVARSVVVLHSSDPCRPSSALKYRLSFNRVNPTRLDPEGPDLMSLTILVRKALPVDLQSSAPWRPSSAEKKTTPSIPAE